MENGMFFQRRTNCDLYLIFFFLSFCHSWAAPAAYGGSQARGQIRAVATGLHQSHSKAGSKPHLQPTSQFMATPDPQPTEQGQGPNLQPHGSQSDLLTTAPRRELRELPVFNTRLYRVLNDSVFFFCR